MLEKVSRPERVRRWAGRFPVRHRYTPGIAGEVVLATLRDEGVLLGSRCGTCGLVYAPARSFCERCLSELSPDVRVGPGGELASFTVAYVGVDGAPLEEPVAFGLVRLDGADTVILHRLLETDEPLEIGARVELVVRPPAERSASIHDIEGFRPVRDDAR